VVLQRGQMSNTSTSAAALKSFFATFSADLTRLFVLEAT
jgi:hypothetical protein